LKELNKTLREASLMGFEKEYLDNIVIIINDFTKSYQINHGSWKKKIKRTND